MDLFDMIGPIMIGPSSSHTAGAARIGLTARMLLGEDVRRADLAFHGSFARTYTGHGTDRAVVGGLMGMHVDDERIRNSIQLAHDAGIELRFSTVEIRDAHPNTVRMNITGVSGKQLAMEASSIGGGLIEIHRLDGMRVNFTGKENTLVIHHRDEPGLIAAVTGELAARQINVATMQVFRQKMGEDAMMVMELDDPVEEELLKTLQAMLKIHSAIFLRGQEVS